MGCGGSKPATQDEDEEYERERAERERALRSEMERLTSPRDVEVDVVDEDVEDDVPRPPVEVAPSRPRRTAPPRAPVLLEKQVSLAKGADVRTVRIGGSIWLYVDGEPVFEVQDAEAPPEPSKGWAILAASPPKMVKVIRKLAVTGDEGEGTSAGEGATREVEVWEWGTEDIGGWPYRDPGDDDQENEEMADALVDEWVTAAVAEGSEDPEREGTIAVDALVDELITAAEMDEAEGETSALPREPSDLSPETSSLSLSAILERPSPAARGMQVDLPDGMFWRPATSGVFSVDELGRWYARAEELQAWSLQERLRMDASNSALSSSSASPIVSIEEYLGSVACAHRATGRGLVQAGRELRTSGNVFIEPGRLAESLLAAVAALAEGLVRAGEAQQRHASEIETLCEAWVSVDWSGGVDDMDNTSRHVDLLGGLVAAELTLATQVVGCLSPAVMVCAECGSDASTPFGTELRDPILHDAAAQLNWCGCLLFWSQRGLTSAIAVHLVGASAAPTESAMARRAAACFGVLAISRHDANLALEKAIRAAGRGTPMHRGVDHFALIAVLVRNELRAAAKAVELVSLVHSDLAKASAGGPMSASSTAALQQWPKRRRVRRTDTGKPDRLVVVARRTTPREGHEDFTQSHQRLRGIDELWDEWDDLAAVEKELMNLTLVDHAKQRDTAAEEEESEPVRRLAGRRVPRPRASGKVVLVSRAKGKMSPRTRDLAEFTPRAPSSVASDDAAEVSALTKSLSSSSRGLSPSAAPRSSSSPAPRSNKNTPGTAVVTSGNSRPGSRTSDKYNASPAAEVLAEVRATDLNLQASRPPASPKPGGLSREVSLAAGSDVRTVRVGNVTWLYVDGEPVFQVPDDDEDTAGMAQVAEGSRDASPEDLMSESI